MQQNGELVQINGCDYFQRWM